MLLNQEEKVNRTHLDFLNPKTSCKFVVASPKSMSVIKQSVILRLDHRPLKTQSTAVNKCMFPQPPLEDLRLCAIRQPQVHTSPFFRPVVTATANGHTHGERILRTRRASGSIWIILVSADHSRNENKQLIKAVAPHASALHKESGRGVKFILSYTTPGY